MKPGHRGAHRIRRTHDAIERALAGVIAPLGTVALLVSESITTSTAVVMLRATLVEHLERQRARATAAREQTTLGAIREAVLATPDDRAPVLIATREGRAILQAVTGEAPPAKVRERAPVTGTVREAVLLALVNGPRTGLELRDALPRFGRDVVGRAIEALQEQERITAVARRGRQVVTWALTLSGEGAARAVADRKAAA